MYSVIIIFKSLFKLLLNNYIQNSNTCKYYLVLPHLRSRSKQLFLDSCNWICSIIHPNNSANNYLIRIIYNPLLLYNFFALLFWLTVLIYSFAYCFGLLFWLTVLAYRFDLQFGLLFWLTVLAYCFGLLFCLLFCLLFWLTVLANVLNYCFELLF